MNRFMVYLGLGSLILFASTKLASAEFPVSIQGSSTTPMAPGITWHNDLQSGWREAKRHNLPMIIFITTDPCIYCDAMKRDTWCNESVQSQLTGKFVAIRLNKRDNSRVLSRIKVSTYPTTLMGSPNGKIVGHRLGYQPPVELKSFLSEAKTLVVAPSMTANNIH